MLTCFYIAGILYISDGHEAKALTDHLLIHQGEVHLNSSPMASFPTPHTNVIEFLEDCDKQATSRVVERDW